MNKPLLYFVLGIWLSLLVSLAAGQDHVARDYRALRWIWIDSTGTMPTGIAGRAALWSRGVNGLYIIFANGTYARLDSGGTGGGYGASPDTVAGIYIDKTGIGAGDIIVHNGSYWVLNAGIASLGDTNHVTFYNAAGDSIRTFLGFVWKHATLDTLYIGGKLSKVEAIRFDDGTTMTTAAGSSVSDVAFADTWNGVTTTAPSKNAIWDRFWNIVSKDSVPTSVGIACSDETTDLTTGTAKVTFRMPYAMTVTAVRASVTTAATGATLLTVDINEGVSSILGTKITLDASEKTSTTAATQATITDASIADDAEMTVDIDNVGNTTAGKGLKIWIIGRRAAP